MPEYEISYACSHSDLPRRKHLNRKTFTAGDRWKWSRYSNIETRREYGFPMCYDDPEYYQFYLHLYSEINYYGKTYRKWSGEPPRFNLKLILRRPFESKLNKGIQLRFRLLRSKNSWV